MTGRLLSSWRCIIPLALGAFLSWTAFITLPDRLVRVSFLDVGQGDAILVRTLSHKVLVDGGPSPQALAGHLGRRFRCLDIGAHAAASEWCTEMWRSIVSLCLVRC